MSCQLSAENIENSSTAMNRYFNDWDLLKIIECLTLVERISIARVCRRWKELVDDSFRRVTTINRRTVLGNCRSRISYSALALIVRKCRYVKHIDLENIRLFHDLENFRSFHRRRLLMTIACNSNRLETINLDELEIKEQQILELSRNCKQLRKFASKNVSEHLFNQYIISLPNLRIVDLSGNRDFKGYKFYKFGENIEELELKNCYQFTRNGLAFRRLVKGHGKQLKKLSFVNNVNDYFPHICKHFQNLTHLKLSLVGIECDFSLISQLKNLISLTIVTYGCYNFIETDLYDLLKSCESLEMRELEINLHPYAIPFSIRNSLTLLETCCPRLEKLTLRNFKMIRSVDIASIGTLKNLKHLNLMNSKVRNNVVSLIESCPLLCYLNLHNCERVGNKVLEAYIKKCVANSKVWHTLDMINTNFRTVVGRIFPKNLILLTSVNDCEYGCPHESLDPNALQTFSLEIFS